MALMVLGQEQRKVKIAPQENSGNIPKTVAAFVKESTYDGLNFLRKVVELMGNHDLASRLGNYVGATALPSFVSDSCKLHDRFTKVNTGSPGFDCSLETLKDICSWTAMGTYTLAFLFKKCGPFASFGKVFNTISDVSEVGIHARSAYEMHVLQANEPLPETKGALESKFRYCLLKMMKSVIAAASGVFTALALMGLAVFSLTTMMKIGLVATIFSIIAFCQKNYFSSTTVEVIRI